MGREQTHGLRIHGGVESRVAILDAAQRLFAERGYSATSTADIAQQAGITRTLIFHYFPTKQRLLTALLEERGVMRVLDEVHAPERLADIERALLTLAASLEEVIRASGEVLKIMLQEREFEELARQMHTDFMDRLEQLVLETIENTCGLPSTDEQARAVASTFAAVLLREVVLDQLAGASTECQPGAHVCALALSSHARPDEPEGRPRSTV